MFKKGDKVVCIKHFKGVYMLSKESSPGPKPVKGEIYTCDGGVFTGIFLKEFNYINSKGLRVRFNAKKFRKVEDNFGEEVLKNITKQIKEEQLELV